MFRGCNGSQRIRAYLEFSNGSWAILSKALTWPQKALERYKSPLNGLFFAKL